MNMAASVTDMIIDLCIIRFGLPGITAGVLVSLLQTSWPDLIVGAIVFLIVVRGAMRILSLAK